MEDLDDSELWMSEDDEGEGEEGVETEDATFLKLELKRRSQPGGFHVRNKPGQKQRAALSGFGSGSRKKPTCLPCWLHSWGHHPRKYRRRHQSACYSFVYDFSFFSYRSTRIKEADISFEFLPGEGTTSVGPTVEKVAPDTQDLRSGGISGAFGVSLDAKLAGEKSVEKETTHAAEITGNKPCDDWGNYFQARWSLKENDSQRNGIATLLRTLILLTQEDVREVRCVPTIEAKPNFTALLGSIFASRTPDDPIVLDPEYEPYNNVLPSDIKIDRWKLGELLSMEVTTSKPSEMEGDALTTKSIVLETGAALTQDFAPIKSICAHLNAFHAYASDPTRHVETNHYCSHPTEDVRQCLLYDSPDAKAHLIGIEYMITPRLFATLDAAERELWHSHVYEVKSGMLIMPQPSVLVSQAAWEKAETAEMGDVIQLYGKVYHLWQVDKGHKVPLGEPQLMTSFTAPGQMDFERLVGDRDRRFQTSFGRKKEIREQIPEPEIHPDADAAWKKQTSK